MENNKIRKYIVVKRKQETPTTTTLWMTLDDGTVPPYIPGQYITVYFKELGVQNGKEYSISSAPSHKNMAITVMAVGQFSNRLCSMKPGDTITASLPTGLFRSKQNTADLFMVAAGMGVTPFRSMILDIGYHNPLRQIYLFRSFRNTKESLFEKDFSNMTKKIKGLRIEKYITREQTPSSSNIHRRIKTEDVLRASQESPNAEFLICGSTSFVCDQRDGLRKAGVPEERIRTEIHFQ